MFVTTETAQHYCLHTTVYSVWTLQSCLLFELQVELLVGLSEPPACLALPLCCNSL